MSTRKKVEMLKDISGDKELVYPLVDAEHVLMSDGRSLEEAISQDLSQAVVEHSKSTFKPGAGDNIDVSNSIVDGEPGEIKIEGQTYQNLLDWPEGPQLTHSKPEFEITDGQPVIEGYPVNLTENDSFKELKIKGQTIKNMTSELSSHEFSVENEDIISAIYDKDEKIDYVDEYDSLVIKGKSVVNMLAETCGTPAKTVENEKDIIPDINSTLDITTTDGLYHEAILYGKTLKNELVPYGTEIEEIHASKVYSDDLGIQVSNDTNFDTAVIKGKTLVNLTDLSGTISLGGAVSGASKHATFTTTESHTFTKYTVATAGYWNAYVALKIRSEMLKPNTAYYCRIKNYTNSKNLTLANVKLKYYSDVISNSYTKFDNNSFKVISNSDIDTTLTQYTYNVVFECSTYNTEYEVGDTFSAGNIIVCEYQEGMENWDLEYFEGMQSVVNPEVITCNSPVRFGKGGRL